MQETADPKRSIQWREIIRQACEKARQTQQSTASRRELSKDKSKSLLVLDIGRPVRKIRTLRVVPSVNGRIASPVVHEPIDSALLLTVANPQK